MAVTGWSGLYDGVYSATYAIPINKSPMRGLAANLFSKTRRSMRTMREVLYAMAGEAGTPTIAATVKRVRNDSGGMNGGLVTIETHNIRASGAVTAAEKTTFKGTLVDNSFPSTYATDASGNGGGGKQPGNG